MNNPQDIELGGNTEITSLTLTNGDLDIGNNKPNVGSATGGSSTSYIKISGTGKVTTEVGSSPVPFRLAETPIYQLFWMTV